MRHLFSKRVVAENWGHPRSLLTSAGWQQENKGPGKTNYIVQLKTHFQPI